MHDAFEKTGIFLSMDICSQLILKHDKERSGSINFNEFNSILQEINQWIVL